MRKSCHAAAEHRIKARIQSMALPGFLDFTRPGRGADSEENCPAFILFFRRYGRHFSRLLFANVICAVICLPVYVWLTGIVNVIVIEETGGVISVLSSLMMAVTLDWPQWLLVTFVVLSALLSGPVAAALTRCALNCAWGIPCLFWSEFLSAFRANWKQALPVGIFDTVLVFSAIWYLIDGKDAFGNLFPILLLLWIFFCFLYFLAHTYFYPVMVTVELPFFALIKNCFILALVQVWRPLTVLLLAAALLFGCLWLDILLVPCFLFSLLAYFSSFMERPVIEKYLLSPEQEA